MRDTPVQSGKIVLYRPSNTAFKYSFQKNKKVLCITPQQKLEPVSIYKIIFDEGETLEE